MDQHASVSSGVLPALLQFQDDILDGQQNEIEADADYAITLAYKALPEPPVSPDPDAPLSSPEAELPPADGVDRLSALPDAILRDIVFRLPARDAARTAALASRWRGVWLSVPLVLVDAHLLDLAATKQRVTVGDEDDDVSRAVVAAASRVLKAHPGPFRFVRLTWSHMASSYRDLIKRWIRLLAAKGVQELDFINRPWPIDLTLPTALFGCTSLTRLHLGAWKFPNNAAQQDGAGFPHLKELFLTLILMKDEDLAFLLKCCPVLEILIIMGSREGLRLSLVSHSLRSLQLFMCSLADLAVEDAPRLERLILMGTEGRQIGGKKCARITITNAPNLCMLGKWRPGDYQLQMGKTVIQAGTKVSSSTTAPSMRILSFEVQFEIRNEVMTLPSFLKCFPNVEALHISSQIVSGTTGKVNLQFWLDAGTVECIQHHVKKLVFHDFRGSKSELAFLKFIAQKARMLESMVIMLCPGKKNDSNAKLRPLTTVEWASEDSVLIVLESPYREGSRPWSFRMASGFSCSDPFDLMTAELRSGASVLPHS